MGRSQLLVLILAACLAGNGALAQSQAGRTGQGGVAVAAGDEGGSILFHPITIGAVVAGVIAVALAVATEDGSPLVTVSTATSPAR